MKKFGIKFKLKDGTIDYYDPLSYGDLSESDTDYILNMSYTYEISKEDVISFEWFDICVKCGYELYNNECKNCETWEN